MSHCIKVGVEGDLLISGTLTSFLTDFILKYYVLFIFFHRYWAVILPIRREPFVNGKDLGRTIEIMIQSLLY